MTDDFNRARNAIKTAQEKMMGDNLKKDRSNIVASVSAEVAKMFAPIVEMLAITSQTNKNELRDAISNIKVQTDPITVDVPKMDAPIVNVAPPQVTVPTPIVNVPPTNFPGEMDIRGWVGLMMNDSPVGLDNPLAVTLRDADGAPVDFMGGMQQIISGGGGGGGSRVMKITNTADDPVPITGTISATFSADFGSSEVGAETLRTVQATDAIASVNVVDAFGSTSVTGLINPDNRVRVSLETGGSGLTDSELRASSIPVAQASGAIWSTHLATALSSDDDTIGTVQVSGATDSVNVVSTVGLTDTEIRASSVPVEQVSGSQWSTLARPINVRGSLATAYVPLTTGSETALLSGVASEYHDMVWVMGANQSDVAVTVDLRASTGGDVIMSLEIPANSTAGIAPAVPYPQPDLDASWTVDMADITGTTVDVTALFSKEV